ncbi:MAG: hypothetical protein ACPGLV_06505 [Bacteroidia bacterium]
MISLKGYLNQLDPDNTQANVILNFRGLNLSKSDFDAILKMLNQAAPSQLASITSISFSYNSIIGNLGAIQLASCLPYTISEIGLVGCGIGNAGAEALLTWMSKAQKLKMVCIEQNAFTWPMQQKFRTFKTENPGIEVVM